MLGSIAGPEAQRTGLPYVCLPHLLLPSGIATFATCLGEDGRSISDPPLP